MWGIRGKFHTASAEASLLFTFFSATLLYIRQKYSILTEGMMKESHSVKYKVSVTVGSEFYDRERGEHQHSHSGTNSVGSSLI